GVLACSVGRARLRTGAVRGSRQLPPRLPTSDFRLRRLPSPCSGGEPAPHTPRKPAPWSGQRVAHAAGRGLLDEPVSYRRVFRLPTSDCVDFPRLARVGGRPPIPPESRRTGVLSGSRPSENRGCSRIASAPAASSDFRLPPTSPASPGEQRAARWLGRGRWSEDRRPCGGWRSPRRR